MPNDEDMEDAEIIEEVQENEQTDNLDLPEQVQDEKLFTQEELDEKIKERVGRTERNSKRKLAEKDKEIDRYKQLERTLRAGLGANENDDIFESVNNFYKEQGVNIPQYEPAINNRDAERLGEYDAKDLIESAEFDEIQERANVLASLKQKGKISNREEAEFIKLGQYLTNELKVKELKEKGADEKIFESKEFKEFSKKFNSDTQSTEIYDLYLKLNHKEVEKPESTGSIKSTVGNSKVKEFYTSEEVDKLSSKDLDNPTVFKNVMASMKKWSK